VKSLAHPQRQAGSPTQAFDDAHQIAVTDPSQVAFFPKADAQSLMNWL
jgi:hypothetical protein